MMSRTQVRQFLAVVDAGSFTRAASALNIAQPSLSSGIMLLEQSLGTRLFERERRRIRLTEAGNQLLPLARTIEREFHKAEMLAGSIPVPARRFRVGILDTLPSSWIARAIRSYQGLQPIELIEGGERELRSALRDGSVDLAVTLLSPVHHYEKAEVLFDEGYRLALPVDHPLAGADLVDVGQVAGDPMLARRACEILSETSRFFTARGVRPRFAMRSRNDDRVMAMVRAGLGLTVAPLSLGIDGLRMIPITDFNFSRTIGLVPASHSTEADYANFAAALRETMPVQA